jgi:hypothetical protein
LILHGAGFKTTAAKIVMAKVFTVLTQGLGLRVNV